MQKKINIATLVPYRIFPASMGGQKAIALFYQYLGKELPVTILSVASNELPAEYPAGLLPLLSNSKSRYINLSLLSSFKKAICEKGFSHLVLEHPYFGWLGYLLKKLTGIQLVVRSHNIEALRFKSVGKWWWPILWRYEKFIHRQANLNFFITPEDMDYAVTNFGLEQSKCTVITYGIPQKQAPSADIKKAARLQLQQLYGIQTGERILLFNGTLDYKPNLEALDIILQQLTPLLAAKKELKCKIVICGKNLPASYNNLETYHNQNIIYAGFVEDINLYFNGADVFINPVTGGGGIKTKLVEALAAGLSCVSTQSGAIGVPLTITKDKMKVAEDNNWKGFADAVETIDTNIPTPQHFFDHFSWENSAKKAADLLRANSL